MCAELKKEFLHAFGPVKRTLKEYKFYIKDFEKEAAKLKKLEDEKADEGEITRQKGSVEETEGAKKQTFKTLIKFLTPLKEILSTIESEEDNDQETAKAKAEIKELKEYKEVMGIIKEAEEFIAKDGATMN